MSDDREDYKRQQWEEDHEGEFDRPCPSCENRTLRLVERYAGNKYGFSPEPGSELWACPCGYEQEGVLL